MSRYQISIFYDSIATKIIRAIRENFEVQLLSKFKSYLKSLPLQDCMTLYALTHRGDKSIHQVSASTCTMKSGMFLCNKNVCVITNLVLLTGIQEEACSYAERVGRNQRHYVPIKQRTQRGKLQTGAEIPGRANLTSKRS